MRTTMQKSLDKMTLAELWELFPITFCGPSERFAEVFAEEERELKSLLGSRAKRISHIGSTAIRGIKTKPIIDILIEADSADFEAIKNALVADGRILMSESPDRLSLNKGYTADGYAENVFHIHVKKPGDCDELYFRDFLNDDPDLAAEYERLKIALYERHNPDRDAYTAGKKHFVAEVVRQARQKYAGRY